MSADTYPNMARAEERIRLLEAERDELRSLTFAGRHISGWLDVEQKMWIAQIEVEQLRAERDALAQKLEAVRGDIYFERHR